MRRARSMAEALLLRNELVTANLGLIARALCLLGLPPKPNTDAWSEGACGLIEAAGRFDPMRGVSFASFAFPRIRGRILEWLAAERTVTGQVCAGRGIFAVRRALRDLPADVEATAQALAPLCRMSVRKVTDLLAFNSAPLRIDTTEWQTSSASANSPSESNMVAGHTPEGPWAAANFDVAQTVDSSRELGEEIRHALLTLPGRSRTIVVQCFGLDGGHPRTHGEIAAELGLTRQRVSQLHKEALLHLRRALEAADQ